MAKRTRRGPKPCPECGGSDKGPKAKANPKCSHQFYGKPAADPALEPTKVVADMPTNAGDASTIARVGVVAQLVNMVSSSDRCQELLGVIRGVGGLRRMKELLEAMSATHVGESKA